MEWPRIPFERAAKDRTGGQRKILRRDYLAEGNLPVIDQGQDLVAGYTNDEGVAYEGDLPVILFGDHTRSLKYVDFPFALGADGVKVLEPSSLFDGKFLFHCLSNADVPAHGYSRHFKFLKATEVPLPPLSEQRRIAEILDQADHLRRLRTEANTKADRILPALFLKMFGDPATNPMGWPTEPMAEAVESLEAGWSAKGEARPRGESEYGVLKVSAVTSRVFRPEEHKTVLSTQIDRRLVIPKRGDLLFSRANTRELVAATCIVEADEPNLFLPDKLWRVNPRSSRATALFLHELLGVPAFRETLRARATGTSGSMLNIPQDVFLATRAPMPPLELQKTFSETAWKVLDSRRPTVAARDRLARLRNCLVSRSFAGALTISWRRAHEKELRAERIQQESCLSSRVEGAQ